MTESLDGRAWRALDHAMWRALAPRGYAQDGENFITRRPTIFETVDDFIESPELVYWLAARVERMVLGEVIGVHSQSEEILAAVRDMVRNR